MFTVRLGGKYVLDRHEAGNERGRPVWISSRPPLEYHALTACLQHDFSPVKRQEHAIAAGSRSLEPLYIYVGYLVWGCTWVHDLVV